MASHLLPPEKRRAAYAVYATCRTADDIVDAGSLRGEAGLAELRRFRDSAFQALDRRSDLPMLRELARAASEYEVPRSALAELFDGLEQDLGVIDHETWEDLERYCQGVAGSVGELCAAVFGISSPEQGRRSSTIAHARTLGVAMQLTNILRDVGEDAARGRCYLPNAELTRFGVDRSAILSRTVRPTPAWIDFMRFQVARARTLYRAAVPGIAFLAPDAQRCALACAAGYSKILDGIEAAHFNTLHQRVSASRFALLRVAWRSWRLDMSEFGSTREAPR